MTGEDELLRLREMVAELDLGVCRMPARMMKPKEVADMLGVKPRQMFTYGIPSILIGNGPKPRRLYRMSDVQKYIDGRRRSP